MNELISLILEKKYDECNELFNQYMEAIKEAKMHEAKKAVAAKMGCGTMNENKNYDKLDPIDQKTRSAKLLNRINVAQFTKQNEVGDLNKQLDPSMEWAFKGDSEALKKVHSIIGKLKTNVNRQSELRGRAMVAKGMAPSKYMGKNKNLTEGLRLIKTYNDGNKTAKVYRDSEWEEYRVKHYTDGKHHEKADYHTNDKEDAHGTAQEWLKPKKS